MAEGEIDQPGRSGDKGLVAYGMSPEMRETLRHSVERALKTAGPDFGAAMRETKSVFSRTDPFALMGVLAMYYGTTEAGSNPEFNRSDGIFWHHLELAQAFAFREPTGRAGIAQPFEVVEPAVGALTKLTHAWMLLEAGKVQRAKPGPERELAAVLMRLRVNSMAVRGWGYQERLVGLLEDLLTPLDSEFEASLGWRPSALARWWTVIAAKIERRLEPHRAAVREAVEWPVDDRWLARVRDRFAVLPVEDETDLIAQVKRDEQTRRGFIYHSSDLVAHQIYRLGLDDLVSSFPDQAVGAETVRAILGTWSLRPGQYGDLDAGRFFLEDPVLERPFVASADDQWHLFCPWVPMHNPFGLLEGLLGQHEDLFEAYRQRRANFLEERAAEVLARAMPGAQVETQVLHADSADGREYENDVLVVLDSYAVVAEAKAGSIGPEARRGRGRSLRERITALLEEPSMQAGRLADQLVEGTGALGFRRKADGSTFELDAAAIRRALTVGVTLEPMAGLLPRLGDVVDAGLTERGAEALAYSINLADLELIVDVLGHPSEVLHYLGRRAEVERRNFLQGDEVDLLGLYLKTGLNLGGREFAGKDMLDATGMSDPIDVWHYRREAGLEAEAPRVERSDWWEAVLSRVESRHGPRWPEIGVTLWNVGPPEQAELEAAMGQLRAEIMSGERPATDLLVFHNGPPQRRDIFVGVIATSADRGERAVQYENAARIVMENNADMKRGIVIAWTPRPIEAPYFALIYFDRADPGSR